MSADISGVSLFNGLRAGWRGIWTIRGHLKHRIYLLFAVIGLLLPLAAWWWLSVSGLMDKVFMPSPMDVLTRVYT